MNKSKRFDKVTVIVLMRTGEQRMTQAFHSLSVVGRAFREAVEAGPVSEAVVVSSDGILKYTPGEVAELAQHPSYA